MLLHIQSLCLFSFSLCGCLGGSIYSGAVAERSPSPALRGVTVTCSLDHQWGYLGVIGCCRPVLPTSRSLLPRRGVRGRTFPPSGVDVSSIGVALVVVTRLRDHRLVYWIVFYSWLVLSTSASPLPPRGVRSEGRPGDSPSSAPRGSAVTNSHDHRLGYSCAGLPLCSKGGGLPLR